MLLFPFLPDNYPHHLNYIRPKSTVIWMITVIYIMIHRHINHTKNVQRFHAQPIFCCEKERNFSHCSMKRESEREREREPFQYNILRWNNTRWFFLRIFRQTKQEKKIAGKISFLAKLFFPFFSFQFRTNFGLWHTINYFCRQECFFVKNKLKIISCKFIGFYI